MSDYHTKLTCLKSSHSMNWSHLPFLISNTFCFRSIKKVKKVNQLTSLPRFNHQSFQKGIFVLSVDILSLASIHLSCSANYLIFIYLMPLRRRQECHYGRRCFGWKKIPFLSKTGRELWLDCWIVQWLVRDMLFYDQFLCFKFTDLYKLEILNFQPWTFEFTNFVNSKFRV